MRSVVVEKPYRFVPPHRGDFWPTWIQRLRLIDVHLRRKEGVVSYEIRHQERLTECLKRGDGILMAPNHCRYADPLVIGWLAREVKTHVYAMASWHLFNKSWFDAFSIPKMGGFSVWREGLDRQALETAVDVLVEARRPLILFPEGSAHRTNDRLQPLLDGVTFIARNAARRREKAGHGKIVMLPVAIKYVFKGDIRAWAETSLATLEHRLTWRPRIEDAPISRVARVAEGLLAIKEVEYLGSAQNGSLIERQEKLVETLLAPLETELMGSPVIGPPIPRVKALRPRFVPALLAETTTFEEKIILRRKLRDLDLAQTLAAYPRNYLTEGPVTETRLLETLERLEEDLLDKTHWPGPLHAIIEVGEPIDVPADRVPKNETDPLLPALKVSLDEMLQRLQHESPLIVG